MSLRLDKLGIAVTEPFKCIADVLRWTPCPLLLNSSQLQNRMSTQGSSSPPKLKTQPTRPQLLVCHDMCGGYREDRFIHGCSEVLAYKLYHWQFIDIFIYFSHQFVTIPPIGWIKAAKKHGVTVLGTVITEWEDGSEICKELLGSDGMIDQFTTKLAQLAFIHGFDGWLMNVENKLESDQVPQLQKFVQQLTNKCHHLLGISKVLWYDSVISSGELKWQNELNSLNNMFFTVSDGIFINYAITDEHLSRTKQMASAFGRELDVFVGVDVYGRGTPGGGGFNTIETMKMIHSQGLSYALFAPGWVHEYLGPENFESQELMFWGILSEMLVLRPVEVPFATSFCRGSGDRYYLQGQVLSDSPWYNLSLQQVQPSFTHSQFVYYTVSKIMQQRDPENESQQTEQKEQVATFRIEVDSCSAHPACPEMMFDLNVGYFGGGSLKLTAKMQESQPVLFRIFVLKADSKKSLHISVILKISDVSDCLCGMVLSTGKPLDGSSTVICTDTDLSDKHRQMVQSMLLQPDRTSGQGFLSTSVCFVTGARGESVHCNDGEWITCTFDVDMSCPSGTGCQNQEFILSAILIPSLEIKAENKDNMMCVHIGHLQVLETQALTPPQKDLPIRNFKCLEVKADRRLMKENVDQILMHHFFQSDEEHLANTLERLDFEHHLMQIGVDKKLSGATKSQQSTSFIVRKTDSSNYSIPLTASRHTIDLTSTSSSLAVKASTETGYTLYLLQWDALKDDNVVYLIYSYDESSQKSFIGHAVENWFLWKNVCVEKKLTRFSIQPITSLPNLVADEVFFSV